MSTTVALGTERGVYLLTDSGGEWKLVGQGVAGRDVTCVALRPGGRLLAGTATAGLFECLDRVEWTAVVNELNGRGVFSIAGHPEQPDILLCGTAPAGLFLSLDGGQSFHELTSLRQHPGASNWTYPQPPYRSRLHRIYLHPVESNVLVVGILSGGVYVSEDIGQTWHERNRGVGRLVQDVSVHPQLAGRLYAATPTGVFVSDDAGQNWSERNVGLAYRYATSLLAHPDDPDILFLLSHRSQEGGGSVYRSSSGGARWEPCEGLPFRADLAFTDMALRGHLLMVTSNQGDLFVSKDLGTTWGKARAAMPAIRCVTILD